MCDSTKRDDMEAHAFIEFGWKFIHFVLPQSSTGCNDYSLLRSLIIIHVAL